jgi:hypothetical protein
MSTMQLCLFVGGCADGTMQRVDIERPFHVMCDLNEQARIQREEYFDRIKNIPDSVTFHQHYYRRELFRISDTTIYIYVYESMKTLEAFYEIINYYGQKKSRSSRSGGHVVRPPQELPDIIEDTNRKV